MTKRAIIIKMIMSMVISGCFYSGCFPLIHELHTEDKEENIWKEFGIINEYVKWKITPEIYKDPKTKKDIYYKGVWQANFKNMTDKKKRIYISFELLDKDNFTIVSVSKGDYDAEAIYLSPKGNKVVEGAFAVTKEMASSAYKSQIRLSARDIEESKKKGKGGEKCD